jgi:hypothetical protein
MDCRRWPASEIRPLLGPAFTPFAGCAEATDEEYLMLHEDKKLELIRLSVTLPRMFTGQVGAPSWTKTRDGALEG